MSAEENKAVVRRFVEEVYNQGRLETLDEIVAPEIVVHDAGRPAVAPGLEGVKQVVSGNRAAFSDFHWTIEDLLADGDRVILRASTTGTHTGTMQTRSGEIPATGKQVSGTVIMIQRIANGKIAEVWQAPDRFGLYEQLGIVQINAPAATATS